MRYDHWDLQLFADGAGDGASGDAGQSDTGVQAADPGRQRLLDLGVPADKIRDRASKAVGKQLTAKAEQPKAKAQDAAADTPPADTTKGSPENQEAPKKATWEELMQDPDYNKRMRETVQSRLRSAKGAQEALEKLSPALEVLARNYHLDINNLDYDALAKAVNDDDTYYERKAMEMGVGIAQAKEMDKAERDQQRQQRQQAITLEQQRIENHIRSLEQQGEALKEVFPSFDLRQELQNPAFARMTHPNVGISVEDAYYAVHRKDIQAASMQATARKTAEKLSNAIQSGSRRPQESGAGATASVARFNYATATRQEREALKARIRRGEKIYPGME